MPHSSGGGSFGGGFHSGGSFGGGSHGSGSNAPRYSSRPFLGGIPYVFYYHGAPHIIYTDHEPGKATKAGPFVFIFLTIFLLLPIGVFFVDSYHNPTKLPLAANSTISIIDENDVFDAEEETNLMSVLTGFQDKSGITPYIITLSDKGIRSLEDYAFSYYLQSFSDESHWLIAYYSEPGTMKDKYLFEGIQGDDTDGILYDEVLYKFNSTLSYELNDPSLTAGDAFIDAFNAILPTLMDKTFIVDPGLVVFFVFWDAIVIAAMVGTALSNKKIDQMKKAVKVENPKTLKMKNCPSCGASYYEGTISCCHKCGRPLMDDEFENF